MQETENTNIERHNQTKGKNYQSYDCYYDTGEEWLGKIPNSWDLTKLKFLLTDQLKYGANESPKEYNPEKPRYIRITDIKENGGLREDTKRSLSEELAGDYLLEEGDILLARSGATVGKATLYQGVKEEKACFAGYLIRVRLNDTILPKYFRYYSSSSNYWSWINTYLIQSTIENVSAGKYKELQVPIPPKKEQKSIVSYLDQETTKIDSLVQEKIRLIDLVKEKRETIINNLVTSGIDNNSDTKEGSLDWYDEIPEGWETTSLRNTVDKFVDYRGATPEKSDSGITLITAKNIDDGNLDFSEDHEYVTEEVYKDWMTRGYPEEGDVLITTEAPMGEVAQVQDTPVALAQRIILLKVNTNLIKKDFLKYFLDSEFNQAQLMKSQTGSTAKGIQASKLKGIRVLIPPLSEQEKIIKTIEQETKKIDELISEVEKGIERLKEYRAALITEAVTGQIDVRGEV